MKPSLDMKPVTIPCDDGIDWLVQLAGYLKCGSAIDLLNFNFDHYWSFCSQIAPDYGMTFIFDKGPKVGHFVPNSN